MLKQHACVLAGLAVLSMTALSSRAETTFTFTDTGLSSIKVDGTELLLSNKIAVQRVMAGGAPVPVREQSAAYDPATKTQKLTLDWGTVSARYTQQAEALAIELVITNTSDRVIDSYTINPLHLASFGEPTRVSQPAVAVDGPPLVTAAGPAASMVVAINLDERPAVVSVAESQDPKSKSPRLSPQVAIGGDEILVDNVTAARPLAPGASDQITLTLRFGKPGTDPLALASPELDAYRKAFPPLLEWKDHRPVLRLFFGGGLPKEQALANLQNPDQIQPPPVDEKFRTNLLNRMKSTVEAARVIDAQAVILWDLEGGTFPHAVTYIGDPRLIRVLNPQMDLVIDEAVKILRDGGLRVGMTLRPSRVVYSEEKKTAAHSHTDAKDPYLELEAKVEYAQKRWSCTVFYVDTNFFWRPYGPEKKWQSGQIAQDVWARLYQKFPDTLFIPEFGNVVDYRATVPYGEADMGNYGTPSIARALYPNSFRVIVVEDADPYENFDRFVAAVQQKNALMTFGFSPASQNVIAISRINRAAAIMSAQEPAALASADADALLGMIEGADPALAYRAGKQAKAKSIALDASRLLSVATDVKRDWHARYGAMNALVAAGNGMDADAVMGLLADQSHGLYAVAIQVMATHPESFRPKLLDRLQTITKTSGDRGQIERIGNALQAIKATDAAPAMKTMFEAVPEGKSQQSVRRALLQAMAGLRSTELDDFYAGLLTEAPFREPAATALVLSGSPDARKRVETALAQARKGGDKMEIEQLSRALRAK